MFLVTLESGTTVAHLLFKGILNVIVKVERGYASGMYVYLEVYIPLSGAAET